MLVSKRAICKICKRKFGLSPLSCKNKIHIKFYKNYKIKFNAYRKIKRKENPHIWGDTVQYIRNRANLLYKKNKHYIYNILGNKCSRCGFLDSRALQIDHIKGGGSKEADREGWAYWKYLAKLPEVDLKDRYQILCANCNWIKRHENKEWHIRKENEDNTTLT